MKTNLDYSFWYAKIKLLLIGVFIVGIFFTPYEALSKSDIIIDKNDLSNYSKVIRETLDSKKNISKESTSNTYNDLDLYTKMAFDVNAKGAIASGLAKYWYPHFLATSVIVYDKSIVKDEIISWTNLNQISHEVGFIDSQKDLQLHVAAISFGLEGEAYSLNKTIDLLYSLNKKGLLKLESKTSPIIICFDYQAVILKEKNRNLEIVVPSEGSLSFEVGLLGNEKLQFKKNLDKSLIRNGLRPLNTKENIKNYPSESSYQSVSQIQDYEHFIKFALKTTSLFSRQVLKERQFFSIDKQEHLMVALVYLTIVTFWAATVIYRATQKPIIYAAIFCGLILSTWTFVRLIRYQILAMDVLSRYLWYSYYIFQIFIPLIILWMAWSMDRPNTYKKFSTWWKVLIIFALSLIFLVFTNDFHNWVLVLDLSKVDWGSTYTYGLGYFIILVYAFSLLLAAFVILIIKGCKIPGRKIFSIPLFIFLLFAIYNYLYITRMPIIYKTDLTIMTGIFTMLMFESNIRFGLIPANTRYLALFKLSPLKIQIFDKNKNLLLLSDKSQKPQAKYLEKLLVPNSIPLLDGDDLIFAKEIPGGYVLWYENISEITSLYNNILENNKRLEGANTMLAKKQQVQSQLNDQLLKQEILSQFESKLQENINKVNKIIKDLESGKNPKENSVRLPLLLTYIKRRSNLFFLEKKSIDFQIETFNEYLRELSKISLMAKTEVALYNEIKKDLDSSEAALMYELFYKVLEASIKNNCLHLVSFITEDFDQITMQLLPSKNLDLLFDENFLLSINQAKGLLSLKSFEDTVGFTISFKKGGRTYD